MYLSLTGRGVTGVSWLTADFGVAKLGQPWLEASLGAVAEPSWGRRSGLMRGQSGGLRPSQTVARLWGKVELM